jgi:hypothetical protein
MTIPGITPDMLITYDPETWPRGDKTWDLARAIAQTEGANVQGSVPDYFNNPGDISDFLKEYGGGYHDGSWVTEFLTKFIGWTALYEKLNNCRRGVSHVYLPTMTFEQFAKKWAGNSTMWCKDVTTILKVSPSMTLQEYWADEEPTATTGS